MFGGPNGYETQRAEAARVQGHDAGAACRRSRGQACHGRTMGIRDSVPEDGHGHQAREVTHKRANIQDTQMKTGIFKGQIVKDLRYILNNEEDVVEEYSREKIDDGFIKEKIVDEKACLDVDITGIAKEVIIGDKSIGDISAMPLEIAEKAKGFYNFITAFIKVADKTPSKKLNP